MGKSFDHWYVIGTSDYLCVSHIALVSLCVSIHIFTSVPSLFQSPVRIICSHWCIHFKISVLRSILNSVLGSFWTLIIVRVNNFWMYAPPALVITLGQYAVMIMVSTLLFFQRCIHDEQPRFLNSLTITIALKFWSGTNMHLPLNHKINQNQFIGSLNLHYTVLSGKLPCIWAFTFFFTQNNEVLEYFVNTVNYLTGMWPKRSLTILFLSHLKIWLLSTVDVKEV